MMELFQQMVGMGHERVLFCSSPEVGLQAIIAVHSTVLGPGLGGVRMWPYQSMDEALTDVLRLSRGMTYKAAATGLNLGGGKAVILGDPKKEKNEALFRTFGRFVDSLGGLYITAEDVGTDVGDMEWIYTETPWVTGVSAAHGGSGDPSPVTAFGVLQGIKASSQFIYGTDSLAGRSVAIQGLGSVGYHLAKFLIEDEKAKVFGADVDAERIARAQELGVEIVPKEEILGVEYLRPLRSLARRCVPAARRLFSSFTNQAASFLKRGHQKARSAGAARMVCKWRSPIASKRASASGGRTPEG
jgi:leucine dehydrogenase